MILRAAAGIAAAVMLWFPSHANDTFWLHHWHRRHRTHHAHRHHAHRRPAPSPPPPAPGPPQPLPGPGPWPKPVLTTIKGGLTIGPGFDGQCSAPYVYRAGRVVGVYIDDTTPNINKWVACAAAQYPTGIVLVAVAPDQYGLKYAPSPPVVNCFEAYAYGYGLTLAQFWANFVAPYSYPCYISQDWFDWGQAPVPAADRWRLLLNVLATGAPYVFVY